MSKNRQNCLCTAMLYDPEEKAREISPEKPESGNARRQGFLSEKWQQFRQRAMRLFTGSMAFRPSV